MRTRVLLDTDILSVLRRGHERVTQHATDYIVTYGNLAFTELTWYEVVRGYRAIGAHHQLEVFEAFCRRCDILPLDHNALDCAANIYSDLRRRGELIGEVDILIAGIALTNGTGIATRNVEHFSRITSLYVENWTV
ncbi:type II toxin-antitoxin system VapC family toxin [Candidatus Poribacteria bacterium]|nr:type II toxin-antitoxin system VapC family toxin [Candidatus Poribacteria bacterium]